VNKTAFCRGLSVVPVRGQERGQRLQHLLGSLLGDPATVLLEAAEEEDEPEKTLLAVGSRGLGPIQHASLASVSTKVLRAARGPVLVYPPPRP
jgi:nucleotide-binding universal stress UspA family protein